MKTHKSIAGLLAEWIVYSPKRISSEAGGEDRGDERHLEFDYWSFLGFGVWDLELPPACHQPSKTPPKSS